jgi:spoIIIJ-associated protein
LSREVPRKKLDSFEKPLLETYRSAMSDPKLQRGQEWLEKLLGLGGLAAQVTATWEIDSCWLTIDSSHLTPEQISILIGAQGEAIDAVQYLANSILNIGRPPEEQSAYTIELDGYPLEKPWK